MNVSSHWFHSFCIKIETHFSFSHSFIDSTRNKNDFLLHQFKTSNEKIVWLSFVNVIIGFLCVDSSFGQRIFRKQFVTRFEQICRRSIDRLRKDFLSKFKRKHQQIFKTFTSLFKSRWNRSTFSKHRKSSLRKKKLSNEFRRFSFRLDFDDFRIDSSTMWKIDSNESFVSLSVVGQWQTFCLSKNKKKRRIFFSVGRFDRNLSFVFIALRCCSPNFRRK